MTHTTPFEPGRRRHAPGFFLEQAPMSYQPTEEELQRRLDEHLDHHLCVVRIRDDDVVVSARDLRTGQVSIVAGLIPRRWADRAQFETLGAQLIGELERMLEAPPDDGSGGPEEF